MKPMFFSLSLVFALVSGVANATDIRINDQIRDAFNENFSNATEVSWTNAGSYYKVNFNTNGDYVTAYYSEEGKLLSITRNVSSRLLPYSLQTSLKKSYANCWISDLTEVNNQEGVYYVATVENGDSKFLVRSTSNLDWTGIRKINK